MNERKSIGQRAREQQASLKQGPMCMVWATLESMDETRRAELEQALSDWTIHATMICRVLQEDGIMLPVQSIQRHRRNVCQCWKWTP